MAGKRAAPATKAVSRPTNVVNPAAGHPPANYPAPAAYMPTGPDVTHISLPSTWPTTPPVLGGVPMDAPPSGTDSPPTPDIPDSLDISNPLPDTNLPVNLGVPSTQAGPGPAGSVTLPSGGVPQATAMEPAGEVPFRPTDTTEQGR